MNEQEFYPTSAATFVVAIGDTGIDSSHGLALIHVGDVISVHGNSNAPATAITRLEESYVSGATTMFVRGNISADNISRGIARIDQLSIETSTATYPSTSIGTSKAARPSSIIGTSAVIGTSKAAAPSAIIGTSTAAIPT